MFGTLADEALASEIPAEADGCCRGERAPSSTYTNRPLPMKLCYAEPNPVPFPKKSFVLGGIPPKLVILQEIVPQEALTRCPLSLVCLESRYPFYAEVSFPVFSIVTLFRMRTNPTGRLKGIHTKEV